jgi:hypothetical protein
VLEATQQLAGAIGIAVIGTIFFSALGHGGFVTAINRCLLVEVALAPVLLLLTRTLPARAREGEPAGAERELSPIATGQPASAPHGAPAS